MRNLRLSRQTIQLKMLLRFFPKGNDRRGFTLIELLVAMLISGLIVSGLLYLVVEVLGINQKDASRSDTQRDIQAASDYIARDLRESFYVYGTEIEEDASGNKTLASCLRDYGAGSTEARGTNSQCTGLLQYLPVSLRSNENIPVLAFWKPEPLPEIVKKRCETDADKIGRLSSDPKYDAALDKIPCVAQRMYTLVIYSLSTENPGNIWKGRARIKRYTVPHFTETSTVKNPGWAAPVASDDKRPLSWPFGKADGGIVKLQQSVASGEGVVLTDFVDHKYDLNNVPEAPEDLEAKTPAPTPTSSSGYCPPTFEVANYKKFRPEFYACVRRASINENPEVRFVIKGNAAGRGGIPRNTGEVPFQMESHVIGRAAYSKQRS